LKLPASGRAAGKVILLGEHVVVYARPALAAGLARGLEVRVQRGDGPPAVETDVPALAADAQSPREVPPLYVAATAPRMQALAGEIADGCLTPSITTPAFVRYTRENVGAQIDVGCTVVASIHESDRDQGRDGAREIAGMYLANKVQNIQGAADTLLDLAGIEQDEIRPVADAMEQGGRLAAKAKVSDALLDKCRPIAGTPSDCIEAIEEYRDAGCTHVMLELWGANRHDQIRLFGEKVLPHFRS
jgi:5,10-methylenetetrahydromethanopterin reductase